MLQHTLFTKPARVFQTITGLTHDEFVQLHRAFAQAYQDALQARRSPKTWRRQLGGGRKGALPRTEDKLLFILVYVRLYPIQELQALLFGMSQSQASEWAIRLLPILQTALGREVALPARRACTVEELLTQCPDLHFLLDATERPVPRPQDATQQTERYSGKKKRHTVKNTLVTRADGRRIVFVGDTTAGRRHDKPLVEDDAPPFPDGSRIGSDSGYQGLSIAGSTVTTPMKKPRGGELTADEKAVNTQLARLRIPVEHAIGGMKRHRIVHDIYRNRAAGMEDQAILVAAGLFNYASACRDQKRAATCLTK
jgi:hypothetical protein